MRKLVIPLGIIFSLAFVAVIAFIADGRTQSGTPAQQLKAWATASGLGQQLGTLQATAGDVAKAAKEHKPLAVFHTICGVYETDAQTYNDSLPSPDIRVTDDLARAYGKASDAAEECYRSGATDTALLQKSERDSAEAKQLLQAALARIAAVTGKTVSTTTTTVPTATSTAFF